MVSLYSTIKMMHGPINIRAFIYIYYHSSLFRFAHVPPFKHPLHNMPRSLSFCYRQKCHPSTPLLLCNSHLLKCNHIYLLPRADADTSPEKNIYEDPPCISTDAKSSFSYKFLGDITNTSLTPKLPQRHCNKMHSSPYLPVFSKKREEEQYTVFVIHHRFDAVKLQK